MNPSSALSNFDSISPVYSVFVGLAVIVGDGAVTVVVSENVGVCDIVIVGLAVIVGDGTVTDIVSENV